QRGQRDQRVPHWQSDVSGHRTISEIPLKTRDGEFFCEKMKHRIGQPEIAFSILKIDRVDFMGHSRRTYLTGYDFSFEIILRYVLPDVAAQINQDGIAPPDGLE